MKWEDVMVITGIFSLLVIYLWNLRPKKPPSWSILKLQVPYEVVSLRPPACGVWPEAVTVQDCDHQTAPFDILAPLEKIALLDVNDMVWVDRDKSGNLIFLARKKTKTSILD